MHTPLTHFDAEDQVHMADVLGVARIAAIQASKRTSDLIPLCHPLPPAIYDRCKAIDHVMCIDRIGLPLSEVSDLLGHSSVAMADR